MDYNLDESFSIKFYTEVVLNLLPLYIDIGFIKEKIIDVDAYEQQNLIEFF